MDTYFLYACTSHRGSGKRGLQLSAKDGTGPYVGFGNCSHFINTSAGVRLLSSVRELRQVFSRVCKGLEESIDPFAEGGTHLLLKHTKALHTLQQSNQALSFLARIASSCYDWDGLNACFGTCTGETACGAHLFDCDTGVEFLQFMARPQNLQQHKHRTGKVFHQFT